MTLRIIVDSNNKNMARNLTITHGKSIFAIAPVKVERGKLYGTTELRVTTPDGSTCHVAGINGDGITIVDTGCTKSGMITEDRLWMERNELIAVLPDGNMAPQVESSFNTEIPLETKASQEDLLSINVSSVYQLTGSEAPDLKTAIGDDIYTFPFSYRGGFETSKAFLLATEDSLYIITGTSADLEYIGIEQSGVLDDGENIDIDDELDFSMM